MSDMGLRFEVVKKGVRGNCLFRFLQAFLSCRGMLLAIDLDH